MNGNQPQMLSYPQELDSIEKIVEKMKQIELRLTNLEVKNKIVEVNACTESNSNEKKINSASKWLKSFNKDHFIPKEKRNNNIILFGIHQQETASQQASKALDKIAVIELFNDLGLTVSDESLEVERLVPKKQMLCPHPILVKLKPLNGSPKSSSILKAAKQISKLEKYKHISISPDLLSEQRIVQKKLVTMRKELNKELRERIPNACFYFCIYNNKIIRKNKYESVSKVCSEDIKCQLNEEIGKLRSEMETSQLGENDPATSRTCFAESRKIREIAEKISIHAISTINERKHWSEIDKINDMGINARLNRLENTISVFPEAISKILKCIENTNDKLMDTISKISDDCSSNTKKIIFIYETFNNVYLICNKLAEANNRMHERWEASNDRLNT
jgi:hypothetical protein